MSAPMRVAVVGGGIAGLTAAYELGRQAATGRRVEAQVFEASRRLGGIVETVREGGFTIENGPDGWLTAKPWASELARELGLGDDLVGSNDATRRTYVHTDGRLVAIPEGMSLMVPGDLEALEGSALFSAAAVAACRAEPGRAAELLAAVPEGDESVAEFTRRHFGPEMLERVAAPLLRGIFGGDVHRLSARAVMPGLVEMEREHGSLVLGLRAVRAREPAGGWTLFTTLRSGMGTLVDRLVGAVPAEWFRMNAEVSSIERLGEQDGTGWVVGSSMAGRRTEWEQFDAVVLACPLDQTRRLLGQVDARAATLLPETASSAVLVSFAFADAARVPVPAGFGFLVAAGDGEAQGSKSLLLACTFVDQKFPDRVPAGGRLIRAYFGGAAAERLAGCRNDEVAAIARLELARILNEYAERAAPLTGPPAEPLPLPVVTRVRRLPASLPQYEVGHLERMTELAGRVRALPGLTMLGNALHGLGLPDIIRDARAAARAIVS